MSITSTSSSGDLNGPAGPSPPPRFTALRDLVQWTVWDQANLDEESIGNIRTFLFTYRTYCTPNALWDICKDMLASVSDDSPNRSVKRRKRIYIFLREWVSISYDTDFRGKRLFRELVDLVEQLNVMNSRKFKLLILRKQKGVDLSKDIRSRIRRATRELAMSSATSQRSLLTRTSADQLAENLCFIETATWLRVAPFEFIDKAWQKEDRDKRSPNLVRLVQRFNQVSGWVSTQIILAHDLDTQVELLKKFIMAAKHLHRKNSFNTMMEIISGLNSHAVSRLRRLWEHLPDGYHKEFETMDTLMQPMNNFGNYRELMRTFGEFDAVFPYLGIYLRDLTFVYDGNPDHLDGKVINWQKMELLSTIIHDILKYTQTPIPFEKGLIDNEVLVMLTKMKPLTEEELYERSQRLEGLRSVDDSADSTHSHGSER